MDFTDIKKRAFEIKNKALKYSSDKLSESSLTLNSKKEFDEFIARSENTKFTSSETGKEKVFVKRVIILFGDEKTDFFKKALYKAPVLIAKSFSQNIPFKLAKSIIKDVKLSDFMVTEVPSLIVFENKEIHKVITGEKNILKLVNSFNLDINTLTKDM
ncbi:hypothetical protein A9Q91_00035 [Candidatus Gracilibacteria bacterium 28_42_T64]|nr:hypothetical protein A9Q91_00035 [Candidatus Gracilibacteria bacterium 28_42_T64]